MGCLRRAKWYVTTEDFLEVWARGSFGKAGWVNSDTAQNLVVFSSLKAARRTAMMHGGIVRYLNKSNRWNVKR